MTVKQDLSVVIPCFNAGPMISLALESILNQSVAVEIIVQDGASTDSTLEVLQNYGDRVSVDSRVDSGQTQALNRALARTHCDVVGWLNADDEYAVGALEAVRTAFDQHPEIDVVYGDHTIIDEHGSQIKAYSAGRWDRKSFLEKGMIAFSGSIFFRKSVVDQFGYFDESLRYCMDYEYCLRISGGTRALYLPIVLSHFRVHGSSKTGTGGVKFVHEAHAIRRKYAGSSVVSHFRVILLSAKETAWVLTRRIWWSPLWRQIRSHKRL